MKKFIIGLAATTMMVSAAHAAQITLGHGAHPGNPRYIAAEKWAEIYEACTGGADSVNVAPSATMGDDVEMLTSTAAGVMEITANSQGSMSQIVPEIGLLGLPFLFSDLPTAWEVVDGEVGDLLDERAQTAGLKILGFWDNGIRHITHVSKHVPTPADLAGMNIRTPPGEVAFAVFNALGASPAPLGFAELPSALQSGVFEGQENPLTNTHSSKIHEITPYITLTGHMYEATPIVAGLGWWSGLDEDRQACALQATAEAGELQRQISLKADEDLRPIMEAEGVTFVEADIDAYRAATQSVYDTYAERYPELVEALRKATGQQ